MISELYNVVILCSLSLLQADDVESKIREIIPPGFCLGTDDFVSLLEKEVNFKPFGPIIHTYTVYNEDAGEEITYQIHKASSWFLKKLD